MIQQQHATELAAATSIVSSSATWIGFLNDVNVVLLTIGSLLGIVSAIWALARQWKQRHKK